MIALSIGALVIAAAVAITAASCRRWPTLAGVVPWLAFLVMTTVAAVSFFQLPFGSGTDELIYHHQAEGVSLSLVLTGGLDPYYARLDAGKSGWPVILGTAYFLVGSDSPYLGIVINAVVAYLAIFLALAAGARIYSERSWREWFGMVIVASPALIMFSATLMRESWAWLTVALTIHGLISLVRRAVWTGSLITAAAVLLAFIIRSPLAPILLAATMAGVIIAFVWRGFGVKGAVLAFLGLGLLGRLALPIVLGSVGISQEQLFIARDYLNDSATSGFPAADPFTPRGLVEALVRVGFGPLPWEYTLAPVWAWIFVNWAYWVLVLLLTFTAVRRAGLNSANVAVLVFAAVLLAGLAVGLTNYGIVVRMRASVLVALLPVMWGILAPAKANDRTSVAEERA